MAPPRRHPPDALQTPLNVAVTEGSALPTRGATADARGEIGGATTKQDARPRRSRIVNWLTYLTAVYLGAALVRGCVVRSYQIPSSSMVPTLVPGETAFVSKVHYGALTPPQLFFPLTDIAFGPRLPPVRLAGLGVPQREDVVAFHRPEAPADGGTTTTYIKRIIGLPGDTVQILAGEVLINGTPLDEPYVNEGHRGEPRSSGVFPIGSGFTPTNFGPLRVPARGDTVLLSTESWPHLSDVLEFGERLDPNWDEGGVTVGGRPPSPVVLKNEYYFVLGDDRLGSVDSRNWGFLPEDRIIGPVVAVIKWSGGGRRVPGLRLVP